MAKDFIIEGMREVALNLERFPAKLQKKALGAALRKGGRVIRDLARGSVPVQTGRLRRSIRVSIKRRGTWVTARVTAGRNRKKGDPFYAIMVEKGTAPHEIAPKGAKALGFAGQFVERIEHLGARAQPYLGPALEAGAQAALEAVRETLAAEIEKLGGLP